MSSEKIGNVTELLAQWGQGDREALEALMPVVYQDLRRLARGFFRREYPGHILQTTALVNEAYLRLVDQKVQHWENRKHFFCIAARMMRRVLVDHSRRAHAAKRGGPLDCLPLEEVSEARARPGLEMVDCVALHRALEGLETLDARQAEIVELKVFGGRTEEEIARILDTSVSSVKREWTAAKAWLRRELTRDQTPS